MSEKIKIHIRIKNTPNSIWTVDGNTISYSHLKKKMVLKSFESVFYENTTAEIYKKVIKSGIDRFKHGENLTIFAYGQTGSGKTHTIVGGFEKGFISLALEDILPGTIELSFFELFNERIFDLFTKNELKMFTLDSCSTIVGLHVEKTTTLDEAITFIDTCMERRKTGKTSFNTTSSRSHAILQIKKNNTILTFIDLAGSEKACHDTARLKEASFINRSLLALGTLVNNLLKNKMVGFRDSKLTRVLQNVITKKSTMLGFCMINCTGECLSESLNTLNFAARFSNVQIKALEDKPSTVVPLEKQIDTAAVGHWMCNNKLEKMIAIQKERIADLENSVLKLVECLQDNSLADAFVLEKQLYKIKLEGVDNEKDIDI